jgi:hypothetical protein
VFAIIIVVVNKKMKSFFLFFTSFCSDINSRVKSRKFMDFTMNAYGNMATLVYGGIASNALIVSDWQH